jgi:hypothetical protein
MTRANGWRILAVAAAACVATAASAQSAAARPDRAAADPGVHVDKVEPPRYVVRPDRTDVRFRIRNRGRGMSKDIRVTVTLTPQGARRPAYTQHVNVPDLAANGDWVDAASFADVKLGRYSAKACARGKQGRRRVIDCRSAKRFSVVPFAWQGTSTWTANFGNLKNSGYRETADTAAGGDVVFTFARVDGPLFVYTGSGQIEYAVSGTDLAGCTHAGSATHPVQGSELSLAQNLKTYSIFGERPASQTFQATQTCPFGSGSFPYTAPLYTPFWLLTGTQRRKPDAPSMVGTHPETAFGGVWTWSFAAR